MVPVTVYGFNGLKYRIETQRELLKSFDKTEVLQKAISQARIMMTECDRLARECDERQCKLEEHLIRILGKMESKSSKSQFVVTSEDFMETLVKLQREVSTPTYPSHRIGSSLTIRLDCEIAYLLCTVHLTPTDSAPRKSHSSWTI